MLRSGLVGATLLAALAGAAGAGSGDAVACVFGCPPPQTVTPAARAGSLEVTVTGAGTRSGGSAFTLPVRTVSVAPVCYYTKLGTGREYARALHNGLEDSVLRRLPVDERSTPLPDWQEHEEDDAGAWWIPMCDDPDRFAAYNATNHAVYLTPGEPVPAGDAAVDPEILAEIAYEQLDLPRGTIRWNPSVRGSGATLVNVDTWVWVEDGPTAVTITAAVPGVSATVDATLDQLEVTAPGADPARCPGAGAGWGPDVDPDLACAVTFYRSTANQPVKSGQSLPTATMVTTATWTASWTSNLTDRPASLPGQALTTTAEVAVLETQSLVTGAR